MTTKKIPKTGISDYVLDKLIEDIESGKYKIGDKLPTEAVICENLSVSRPSVREALSALRLAGVVETRKGDGTYVKSISFNFGQHEETFDHGTNIFELLEARRIIEPAVGQLAVGMMTEEYKEKIKVALDSMHACAEESNFEAFHFANKKFHMAIVESTHNTSLINYVRSVVNLFTENDFGYEMRRRYLTDPKYIVTSLQIHDSIFESLKSKDRQMLSRAFAKHNTQVEEQLLGR